jgi:hypothetical protein
MRFRSERDQQLAIEVIRQMVALVDSLLYAVCMQYLAHQYFNVDPRQVLWVT